MKRLIICGNPTCGKLTRLSSSYLAKLEDYSPNPANRYLASEQVASGAKTQINAIKVRLCRNCIRKAGYKISKRTPAKPFPSGGENVRRV